MPTYEYDCTKCGHVFEKFQSMSDEPERICPECNGPVKRRIGTGSGIIFKGQGFYSTDYRSKEYKEKARSDSGSAGTPTAEKSPSSSKSDTGSGASSTPASPPPATSSGDSGKGAGGKKDD